MIFPALWASYRKLLWIVNGSSHCLLLPWLVALYRYILFPAETGKDSIEIRANDSAGNHGFLRSPTMIDSFEERNRWYKFNFNESARWCWRNSTRLKTLNCNHSTNHGPEINWDNVRKWWTILVDFSKIPKWGYKFNVSGVLGHHSSTTQAQYCDKAVEHRWLPSTQRRCMYHSWQGTLCATLLYYSLHPLETFSVFPTSEMGSNISNTRKSVWSDIETLRSGLKKRGAAEFL